MVHNRVLHETYRHSQQRIEARLVHVSPSTPSRIFSVTFGENIRAGAVMWSLNTEGKKRVIFRITPKGVFIRRKRFPVSGFQLNTKGQVRELREERL